MWNGGNGNPRAKGSLPLNADINVTSLVDVAFTLLVIFIITAPIMQGGVEVDLPSGDVAPITASEGVVVTVAADDRIYIGDIAVESTAEFRALFPEYVRENDVQNVYFRGDRRVAYGRAVEVLSILHELEVRGVSLVIEPAEGQE